MSRDEILAIERRFIDAPLEEALACVSEDHARFDFIPPLRYSGKKAVRKVFEAFFANVKDLETDLLDLDAAATDDMGVAWSVQRFRWKFPDGKPGAATVRVTHCFRKEGVEWKMFHSHVSAPVHAGTGKAEMNLDP